MRRLRRIRSGSTTGTGDITFGGGTLRYSASTTFNFAPRIVSSTAAISIDTAGRDVAFSALAASNTGGLTKFGAGTLSLVGANPYTVGTTISAGTLSLGGGATNGSILGNVVNDAALLFNRSDAVTFGGAISGSGTVAKQGAGLLTLTGNNCYAGATAVDVGGLLVNGVNSGVGLMTVVSGGGAGSAADIGTGRTAYFTNTSGAGGLSLVVVHEPGTFALAGLGLAAAAAWIRRRRIAPPL